MEQTSNGICARTTESTKPNFHSWFWSVAVVLAFIVQVIMNILSSETFGSFGGGSNSELSKEYPTFLTPDGLTFSVWGIIYLFQGVFTIYQVLPCFHNSHAGVSRARFWVVALFIVNGLWLPVFSNRRFWLALVLMLVMDLCLIMIYRMMMINYGAIDRTQDADMMLPSAALEHVKQTRSRLGDPENIPQDMLHPWHVKVMCFVGFSTNASWLAVATMVNLLVATGTSGWHQAYTVVAPSGNNGTTLSTATTVYVNGNEDFTIMAVCLVALLACVMVIRNGDAPYALVAMWALGGVYRAQASKAPAGYPDEAMSKPIADWAMAMIIVVAITCAVGLVKAIVESVLAGKKQVTANDLEKPMHTNEQ